MEYSEELIADLLEDWNARGFTDTIIIEHGFLFAINEGKYFPIALMKEVARVNFYDENLSGTAWSMHAITLDNSSKGVLVLGGNIYNPSELTMEIRTAFELPSYSSDYLNAA